MRTPPRHSLRFKSIRCRFEGTVVEELGLNPVNAGERGLRLLFVLSFQQFSNQVKFLATCSVIVC